jgi:DNA-binding NarL/FixJ family response regulator
MNITEAVNMIFKRYPDYGYDVFMDLSEIKDDDLQEAVRFIASMRRRCCTETKRKRVRKINRETLRDMIKKGYTYKGIARETGLAESTVVKKGLGLWF